MTLTTKQEAAFKRANEAAIAYAKITTDPQHKAVLERLFAKELGIV